MKTCHFFCALVLILIFFFAFSETLPVFAEDTKSRDLVINPDRQYQFAMDCFEQSRYDMAIAEFERFAFFFPDHPRVHSAKYHIGLAYAESGRFKEAVEPFSDIIENSDDPDLVARSHFRLSEIFVRLQDHETAIKVLDHLVESGDDIIIIDEAHYRAGWIYLQLNDIETARSRFDMISAQNRDGFRMQTINEELGREKLFSEKNPRLAGFLSIIPGAGFAYCERYKDALVAFLLNAGLMLAAYESFENGNEALGGVIAFVGAGFYAGNIYGAVSSAHKYNRSSHQRFLENLRNKTQVTLSAAPESRGMVLGFRVTF